MKKQKKYLSDYEEDLVWMSYRYCIGRHTISANMHARNIAQHTYDRLSTERLMFIAQDIRRCIEDCLRFGQIHIYFDFDNYIGPRCSYELFLNALKELNLTEKKDLRRIKEIRISYVGNKFVYDVLKLDVNEEDISDILMPDVSDLNSWAVLASCFDVDNHKMIVCKDKETGKETIKEAFEIYALSSYDSYAFKKYWIPVESYIKSNNIISYIDPDCIVSVKDIEIKL